MNRNNEINEALREFSSGDKETAYKKLKIIFDKNKENDQLRFNLAVIQQSLNLNEDAIENYKFLIKKNKNTKAMINLYLLYIKQESFGEAIKIISNLIKILGQLDNLVKDKAFVLFKQKKYKASILICKKYLEINHKDVNILNILGLNFFGLRDNVEAEKILKHALSIDKNNFFVLNSLGRIYHDLRDSINAEKYLLAAYKLENNSYEIINNLAGFYREEEQYQKAINLYNKALKINPTNPSIINNLAKVYFDIEELSLAEEFCFKALKLDKNNENIKKIISLIYFRKKDYKNAWFYFDGRLNLSDFVEKNKSIVKIRNKLFVKNKIHKQLKLLVLREQGVGDEILYGTMYKDLLNLCDNVTIECDKRLKNIFQKTFKKHKNNFIDLGLVSNNQKKIEKYDHVIYAGSLGKFFRQSSKNFNDGNYLNADTYLVSNWNDRLKKLKNKFNIGVSWKSFKNRYSREKSLELNDFNKILNNKKFNFINMQYGDVREEIKKYNEETENKIISFNDLDLFNNFDQIAALLKNLDLFISVSNSTAHLAGSLGVKTLLIKPPKHAVFHYWNQSDHKTPWYKSIDLIEKENLKEGSKLLSKYFNL